MENKPERVKSSVISNIRKVFVNPINGLILLGVADVPLFVLLKRDQIGPNFTTVDHR